MTSSIKMEVHNILQHRQRRTEPYAQKLVKIGRVDPEICSRSETDRQTDRHGHHNTPPPLLEAESKTDMHLWHVFYI